MKLLSLVPQRHTMSSFLTAICMSHSHHRGHDSKLKLPNATTTFQNASSKVSGKTLGADGSESPLPMLAMPVTLQRGNTDISVFYESPFFNAMGPRNMSFTGVNPLYPFSNPISSAGTNMWTSNPFMYPGMFDSLSWSILSLIDTTTGMGSFPRHALFMLNNSISPSDQCRCLLNSTMERDNMSCQAQT